jgi:hypothetical protein
MAGEGFGLPYKEQLDLVYCTNGVLGSEEKQRKGCVGGIRAVVWRRAVCLPTPAKRERVSRGQDNR